MSSGEYDRAGLGPQVMGQGRRRRTGVRSRLDEAQGCAAQRSAHPWKHIICSGASRLHAATAHQNGILQMGIRVALDLQVDLGKDYRN